MTGVCTLTSYVSYAYMAKYTLYIKYIHELELELELLRIMLSLMISTNVDVLEAVKATIYIYCMHLNQVAYTGAGVVLSIVEPWCSETRYTRRCVYTG